MADTDTVWVSVISLHPGDGGVLDRLPTQHQVPGQCTVDGLLTLLGLDDAQRAALWSAKSIAVYGVTAKPDTRLVEGDRVEILDRLRFDPMESRRRRAAHRRQPPKSRQRLATKVGV